MERSGHQEETDDKRVHDSARDAIEEARMVLPGIQALFGFQLIAVFNNRFEQLTDGEQFSHYAALLLVAIAIALIMTPAAYHRIVEPGTVSRFFVNLASSLVAIAMLPLMVAISLEVYLLGRMVIASVPISAFLALSVLVLFAGLWFVFPLAMRRRGSRA
jgi:Family of unknown function (DUF6328)